MTTRKSAKSKGRGFQKKVAQKIREFFGLEDYDVRSTPASVGGEDILMSEFARKQFPFSVECKAREQLNIWEAIAQAERNSNGYVPLVIFTKNYHGTYVTIDFESFLALVKYGGGSLGIKNGTE